MGTARAWVWEFYRLSRRRVVTGLTGVGIYAVFYAQLVPSEVLAFTGVYVTAAIVFVFLLIGVREDPGLGFDQRLFRLPVPTWNLVAWRMGLAVGLSVLMYACLGLLMRISVMPGWPILGPGLFIAALMAWALAVTWAFARSPLLVVLPGAAVVLSLLGWIAPRFGVEGFGQPTRLWTETRPGELIFLLGTILLAYALAVFGVGRDRRGSAIWGLPLPRLLRQRQAQRPFASAAGAQFWMEWRQKGRLVPLTVGAGVFTTVGMQFVVGNDAAEILRSMLGFVAFAALLMPPAIGLLIGRFHATSRRAEIDLFRATRPLADRKLAWVLLGVGGFTLLVSWVVVLAGVAATAGLLWALGDKAVVQAFVDMLAERATWMTVGIGLGGWVNMAIVASVTLTGRNAMVGILVDGPYALIGVGYLLTRWLGGEQLVEFFINAAIPFSLVPIATSVLLLIVAHRRGHLDSLALGLIITAIALLAVVVAAQTTGRPVATAMLLAAVFLAAAPLGGAPLAVAWNRHR